MRYIWLPIVVVELIQLNFFVLNQSAFAAHFLVHERI